MFFFFSVLFFTRIFFEFFAAKSSVFVFDFENYEQKSLQLRELRLG